jgi:predicted Fe-S protein YdhL (DUF1289 family)
MTTPVDSPCVRQCQLDSARTHCTSCHRTLDEIRNWRAMTDSERRTVCNRVQKTLDNIFVVSYIEGTVKR